jgi:GcrA cell cycle regulator
MTWTAEADAMLVRLWKAGGSLTSVAAVMTARGFAVTRGAVSGRRMRLGLARPRNFTEPRPPREPRVKRIAKLGIAKPVERPGEVEYLDLPADGCKAILEKRGRSGLRMCCGRLRTLDYRGSLSPYCEAHYNQFATPTMRKPDGESSQVRKH